MAEERVSSGASRAESSPSSWNPFLRSCLTLHRGSFMAVVLFSFIINLLMLTVPLYLLQIFNRVIPSQSIDTLLFLTAIVVIALITLSLLESTRRFVFVRLGTWLDKRLGGFVLSGSIVRSTRKYRPSSAQTLRDLTTIRHLLSGSDIFPILDAPWTPIFLLVLFLLHPLIGMISLVGAVCLFCLALINEISTRQLIQDSNIATSRSLDYASAILRNSDVIEAMGMRRNVIGSWNEYHRAATDLQSRTSMLTSRIEAIAKFLRLALQVIVIGTAGYLVLSNQLSAGALIASVLLMRRAVAPMDRAISSWKMIVKARNAFRRVSSRLDLAPELAGNQTLPMPSGYLSVRDVGFRYPGRKTATLRGATFKVHPGESIGLTGDTAAGKTTLARLLAGLAEPDSGYIRMGGIDVTRWDTQALGPFVGYLPQDSELFSGTVRHNIARMGESVLADVIEAAKLAGVHEMVMQFPEGYDTEIGEEGAYLSGGQRQRIALARAVYGYPKLVILDEPDANLDSDGKTALARAINELKRKGSMIVLISHQNAVLRYTDTILVLRKGRIETTARQAIEGADIQSSVDRTPSHVVRIEPATQGNQ